jgi:GNAT superfamily N-acetyltransferase
MWRWQYASHYLGPPRVAVARFGGRVVGLQPSIRQEIWWRGVPAAAYQLCHVVTHPDYRRRGVFTGLVEAFARHAEREGAMYVYTFPNRLSYPGFQRAPFWDHPFSMPLMARVAVGSGRPPRGDDRVRRVQVVHRFDHEVDVLGAAIATRFPTGRLRDHRYLNWRYIEHPERAYVCLALRDGSSWRAMAVGRLVDWFGVRAGALVEMLGDSDALDQVIAALERALVGRGARMLGSLMFQGRDEADLLRRRGYRTLAPWMVRKKFYFVVRAPRGLPADLRRPSGWWLTWGDNDIV